MDFENMTKEELIEYIKNLSEDHSGKYGLIWDAEKVPEQIVVDCNKYIPVLKEVEDKKIDNGGNDNILIEGDNFHSLSVLNYTHKEAIDVIYIDPPYNTGNKDFMYNDKFVDIEDGYRHSKWLNFMYKRLKIARELLKDTGYIFISIDDNEQAQLKLLCDKVFGQNNFISNSFVLDNLKGKTNDNFVTSVGSRLYIYAKKKREVLDTGFSSVENLFAEKVEKKYKLEDELGLYNDITFKKTGQAKYRENRPSMYYPILAKDGILYSITDEEYNSIYNKETKSFDDKFIEKLREKYKKYEFILPLGKNNERLRWTSGFNTFKSKMNNDIHYNKGVKQKSRIEAKEILQIYASGTPKSLMYKPAYSNGTQDLKEVLPNNQFDFPKPVQLIKDIINLIEKKDITILDFFAGSGTTAQAVLELNKEDGGNRKFILCTNNENNICEDITYQRIKTVITGKRKDKSVYSKGLLGSLKYFKTDFVENNSTRDQIYFDLTEKCISMLCVKESTFDLIYKNDSYVIYTNRQKENYTCIYYDIYHKNYNDFINKIREIENKKSLYIFSLDNRVEEYELEGIKNYKIESIQQKIYDLYKKLVKLCKES